MEDEERQKKLEAGKAKVREPEALGPAVGGGGWKGVGEGLARGDRSSLGSLPRREVLQDLNFPLALFSPFSN